MKIVGKVKIKDNITVTDIANVISNIVDSIIYKEAGEIIYQPYFFDEAVKMSVFLCLVEGVELEPDDKIMDILQNDKIIKEMVENYIINDD